MRNWKAVFFPVVLFLTFTGAMAGGGGGGGCATAPATQPGQAQADPVTLLISAAARGDTTTVLSLLARGADVNAASRNGTTALYAAAYEGRLETLNTLLARDAIVDAPLPKGNTALHHAAAQGHVEIVRSLLKNGANVNARNEYGDTPLVLAAMNNHPDVVAVLRDAGGRGEVPTGRVGLEYQSVDGKFVVVRTVPGSPADRAGLLKGDEIVSVDDAPLTGLDERTVVEKLRGPSGTGLKITVRRQGNTDLLDFNIVREGVETASRAKSEETPWWRTQ